MSHSILNVISSIRLYFLNISLFFITWFKLFSLSSQLFLNDFFFFLLYTIFTFMASVEFQCAINNWQLILCFRHIQNSWWTSGKLSFFVYGTFLWILVLVFFSVFLIFHISSILVSLMHENFARNMSINRAQLN